MKHEQYPFFVYPIFDLSLDGLASQSNVFISGGALIDRRWIITGARWIPERYSNLSIRVVFNETTFIGIYEEESRNLGFSIDIANYHFHPFTEASEPDFNLGLIEIPENLATFTKPLSLPLPGDDEIYIDSNETVQILSSGPSFKYNHTENNEQRLRRAEGKVCRFCCARRARRYIYWGDEQWYDYNLSPQQVCISFPAALKRDLNDIKSQFLLCQDDSGGLIMMKPREDLVLQAIISRKTTIRCGVGFDPRWVLWKQAHHLTRIHPHMAFILHTIDSSSTDHGLSSTMNAWMVYPHIVSAFFTNNHHR